MRSSIMIRRSMLRLFSNKYQKPEIKEPKEFNPKDKESWWKSMPSHQMMFDPITMKMAHPTYDMKEIEQLDVTHVKPKTMKDKWAYMSINMVRKLFDLATKYDIEKMNEQRWLTRVIFLETIAGVPGFVGGMCRHLRSLRTLKRDNGWINHLLAEAENERQHLVTFMHLKKPGYLFRFWLLAAQGVYMNMYFVFYILAPKTCHRFVGYLEEEAVKTYTHLLHEIDHGNMNHWASKPASMESKQYWDLPENATIRDVVLAIRADEAIHREFNHHLADVESSALIPHHKVITKSPMEKRYHADEGLW